MPLPAPKNKGLTANEKLAASAKPAPSSTSAESAPAKLMSAAKRAVLMVTGGELSGARMYLDVGREYSVGSNDSHDIVLRGAVADDSFLKVLLSSDKVTITFADASLSSPELAYRDEVRFGSARFFVVEGNELANLSLEKSNRTVDADLFSNLNETTSANAANSDSDIAHTAAQTVPEDNSIDHANQSDQQSSAKQASISNNLDTSNSANAAANSAGNTRTALNQSGLRRFLRPLLYASAIVLLGIFLTGVVLLQSGRFQEPVAHVASIESQLADAGFAHLNVDRSQQPLILSGYVKSRQDSLNLAQVIANQTEAVTNHVHVDAEIKNQIENVLRVNGVNGLVESLGEGVFVANTQLPLGARLDGLQGMIESDVPSIASFSVKNQLPEQPFVEPVNEPVQLDAGKRVVLVNSDKPAYVVTEDQSRYFIGSILPGGYRISEITNGRVFLEKQGKTTELKF